MSAVRNAAGDAWNWLNSAASVILPARRGLAGLLTVTVLLIDAMRPAIIPSALYSGSLDQGLSLVHFSAQLEPFLAQNTP